MYVLQLFDSFAVGKALLFVGVVWAHFCRAQISRTLGAELEAEIGVIAWVYGADRLAANLEEMLGRSKALFAVLGVFRVLWTFVAPALLVISVAFALAMVHSPFSLLRCPWEAGLGMAGHADAVRGVRVRGLGGGAGLGPHGRHRPPHPRLRRPHPRPQEALFRAHCPQPPAPHPCPLCEICAEDVVGDGEGAEQAGLRPAARLQIHLRFPPGRRLIHILPLFFKAPLL